MGVNCQANGILFRQFFPVFMFHMILPRFSSSSFGVLGFTLKSLIHLKLIFIQGE